MGSLDTKWKYRFAPVNTVRVGVNEKTGKMMNEK